MTEAAENQELGWTPAKFEDSTDGLDRGDSVGLAETAEAQEAVAEETQAQVSLQVGEGDSVAEVEDEAKCKLALIEWQGLVVRTLPITVVGPFGIAACVHFAIVKLTRKRSLIDICFAVGHGMLPFKGWWRPAGPIATGTITG